jgi:hypothetical protein
MPTWVRQQLENTAALLAETPERTKAEFRRLGLLYVLRPVHNESSRSFLRAEGTTDLANIVSGQSFQCSTTDSTDLRQAPRRTSGFVVDLPANSYSARLMALI